MTANERRVDEKGRVTIPRSIRESLGIEPGEDVTITVAEDRVVIRPQVSREEFAESMAGIVSDETRAVDAEPTEPQSRKSDWTSDL